MKRKAKLTKKIVEFMAIEMVLDSAKVIPDFAFQVFVARNLKSLGNELAPIKEKGVVSDEYKKTISEFETLRKSLSKEELITEVNEVGDTVTRYDPLDAADFDVKIKEFWSKAKNKKIRKEHETNMAEYKSYVFETDLDIELDTFDSAKMPVAFLNKEGNEELLLKLAELLEELFV